MKRLTVYLHGERVGALTDADEPVFTYDDAWLAAAAPVPLSRQLPLRSEAFSGRVVRGFFGGLLPEADARERIAAILGISSGNDFALLERIGGECAGAVSLLLEEMPFPSIDHGNLRWLSEVELAAIVQILPQRPLLAGDVGLRLSLAGAQVKLPVVIDTSPPDGRWRAALALDGTPSTHIIKPEPARFPGLVANEAWCLAGTLQNSLDENRWCTLIGGSFSRAFQETLRRGKTRLAHGARSSGTALHQNRRCHQHGGNPCCGRHAGLQTRRSHPATRRTDAPPPQVRGMTIHCARE